MKTAQNVYCNKVSAIHSLRVNIKSLAAESRFIRKEEKRCGKLYRERMYFHRIGRLRDESRHTGLALAFLRGRPYKSVEQMLRKSTNAPDAARIAAKLKKNGIESEQLSNIESWLNLHTLVVE